MACSVLRFEAGAGTLALVEDLKKDLNARSTAHVLRKALAFARIAADQARESEGIVVIRGGSRDDEVSVALRG